MYTASSGCAAKLVKLRRSSIQLQPLMRWASSEASTEPPPPSPSHKAQASSPPIRKKNHSPRRRVFSGIQPTGVPHLGNYLGALQGWKQLQDEKTRAKDPKNYQLYFCVVDLHAITVRQDPQRFLQQRLESFASLLSIGLDPQQSVLFLQSQVPHHTQLMWILSTLASTGYLSRMTQWKSKLGLSDQVSIGDQSAREKLKLGLFSYPVLQAADILLYKPDLVPVGQDQTQHIEFARTLARSFNANFNLTRGNPSFFNQPKLVLSPAKRVMSLRNPLSKMSKSDPDPRSRILITDSPAEIQTRIQGALTDSIEGISYDPQTRPGVSNLVEILKHVTKQEATCEELAADNANVSMRAFKELVATQIAHELEGFGDRFNELMKPSNDTLVKAMEQGRIRASKFAGQTMRLVEESLGMSSPPSRRKSKTSMPQSSEQKKEMIQREQEAEERDGVKEPDVLPQQEEGVNHPIAS